MRFIQWLRTQTNRVGAPWNYALQLGLVVIAIVLVVYVFGQIQACGYDKARKKYEAESQTWQTERAKLIATAEEKERRIAELEPQVQAFKAAAEAGKRVDEALADKIEQVAKESANAEANAEVAVDCRVRAQRICDLFKRTDKRFDCKPIFDACSGQ